MSYKLGPKQRRGVGVGRGQVGWKSGLAAMGAVEAWRGSCGLGWKSGLAGVGCGVELG